MVGNLLAQKRIGSTNGKSFFFDRISQLCLYFTYSIYLEQKIPVYLDGSVPVTSATDHRHEGGASSYM